MTADDPVAKALAALEPDIRAKLEAMPPEEQDLAAGTCLWLNGYSYRKAAALAGCETTTLFRRCRDLSNDAEHEIKDHLNSIAPVYAQLALELARQQLEDVLDPKQKHSLGSKMAAGGVATDKLVKFAELQAKVTETPNQLSDFFERLAKQGVKRVSLEVESDPPAIDVTPKDDK